MDPSKIRLDDYMNKEDEGILFIDHAGEILNHMKLICFTRAIASGERAARLIKEKNSNKTNVECRFTNVELRNACYFIR